MAKINATPQLLEAILRRIPEGFIHKSILEQRLNGDLDSALSQAVGRIGETFFDTARQTPERVVEYSAWCFPAFPNMGKNGKFHEPTIAERRATRDKQLQEWSSKPAVLQMMATVDGAPGYLELDAFTGSPENEEALYIVLLNRFLRRTDDYLYDHLRLSSRSLQQLYYQQKLAPLHQQLTEYLLTQPGQTASVSDLGERFGQKNLQSMLSGNGFATFKVPVTPKLSEQWVRLKESDANLAHQIAQKASRITDESWQSALEICGEVIRPGARDGKARRIRVLARSYTLNAAAQRLGLRLTSVEAAVREGQISTFIDPEKRVRIPAVQVEAIYHDTEQFEKITAHEVIRPHDLALLCDLSYSAMRSRLLKAHISATEPRWGQVRGKWDLPETWQEFHELLELKTELQKEQAAAEQAERQRLREIERERVRREREIERQRREALRAKLIAAFPTWQHDGRAEQRIIVHIGPPNSGKTHEALDALAAANSGWYLAPLRLLAFEVFDRLNQRGVLCNLLTGEEFIPVPGAKITAATVEMFNPGESGDCVIIDEAQMLADPDRGWAWTRALMEAQAPDIHIIGPYTAQPLIEKLANAAAIPLETLEHQRLAPIAVAEKPWSLLQLPPRTILVAFTRQMVLALKTELEKARRSVSVVYGNLPPEVRRKQADRFAEGQTEICVATDAVGMGLNLPADYVCFYEVEKFDGFTVRMLTPAEVHQIGGRAGRFGLSKAGEIGATSRPNLRVLRALYSQQPEILTRARVAPTVEDLEMLPGNLAEKLTQWAALDSIPDSLRGAITTADMKERIELARMLSDDEVEKLGLAAATKLINAPTRERVRSYWRQCASAILANKEMPLPPDAPRIDSQYDLEVTEHCIAAADIYLWLARRHEFNYFAPEEHAVREMRMEWSLNIDNALLRKLDTARRCTQCRRPLPMNHRFPICDKCYYDKSDDYD